MFGEMGRMYAIYGERGQRACSRMLLELLFEPLRVLAPSPLLIKKKTERYLPT
jgi:hypothetical protein